MQVRFRPALSVYAEQQTRRVLAAIIAWWILTSAQVSPVLEQRFDQGVVLPKKAWSAKRERQYMHIKDSLLDQGKPEPLAEEIAARVVNKERAQHGESVEASAASLTDMSAGRRGGLRSHQGPGSRTLLQLRSEARRRGVTGRSTMNKAQLEAALTR